MKQHLPHLVRWLSTVLIALVLASAYLLDGPSDISTAQAASSDVQDASKTEAATVRRMRATAVICGQNRSWTEQQDGSFFCIDGERVTLAAKGML